MTEAAIDAADHLPIQPMPPAPELQSKWPKVIGIISMIYAIGGLMCQIVFSMWVAFGAEQLMAMGKMDVELPLSMKITTLILAAVALVLGVVMIAGSVQTLRRQPTGPRLLRIWAVLRLLLVLLRVGLGIAMAGPTIEFSRTVEESQVQMMKEAGREPRPLSTDQQLWRNHIIGQAVFAGIFSIYPLFLGFYLSRRKIRDEVAQWV